jgi:hypothetical protein
MRRLKNTWVYILLAAVLGFVIGKLTSQRQIPVVNENPTSNRILSEISEIKISQHSIQEAVTRNPRTRKLIFCVSMGMLGLGALIVVCITLKTESPLIIFLVLFSNSMLAIGGNIYAQYLIDKP